MINKDDIQSIVGIFYQPNFKIFYVNSVDGRTFIRPVATFVSLGITTSKKVLSGICKTLEAAGYNAVIGEISSERIQGQYLNTLLRTGDDIEQYPYTPVPEDNVLDREDAKQELASLQPFMSPDEPIAILQKYAPKITKLRDLIEKLDNDNGWEKHMIQKEDEDYHIFHKFLNYKKSDEIEYRIGIYVTEKN